MDIWITAFQITEPFTLWSTVTIWIPETLIPDSMVSGMQMVKSHDLANHLNIVHFGALIGFFSPVFRPTFEYWTQIYHSNTRLVRYSDGYCISSLVFSNSDTHNHGTEHHNGQTIISFRSQFKKEPVAHQTFFYHYWTSPKFRYWLYI